MSEIRLARKMMAAVAVVALAVAGCTSDNQVGGVNIVDCTKGPKTGETITALRPGGELAIGGNNLNKAVGISLYNGGLRVWRAGGDHDIEVFPSGVTPTLNDGEVGVDNEGTIFAESNGVDYRITGSRDPQGGTTVDIKATCK
jgi:hypothetical protein